jgi:outer membrane immunogenic protein
MRAILVGGVLLLTFIGQVPAHAQNQGLVAPVMAGPPVTTGFIWAGPYIGVFGGYGFGRSTATTTDAPGGNFGFDEGADNLTFPLNPTGVFGGVTVGYNQQAGAMVFGVEGDVGYLNLRDTVTTTPGNPIGALDDDTGTVTYGFYATLLFARAGGIIAQYLGTYGDLDGGVPDLGDQTTLGGPQYGYVIGAGAEFAFGADWTAKLEYNFLNLGTDTTTNVDGDTFTHRNQAHLIRFGLNFLFGN